MSKDKGRSPDLILKVMDKKTGEKAKQGAAWINEDGSITVQLDLCCTLTRNPDIVITLFPADK